MNDDLRYIKANLEHLIIQDHAATGSSRWIAGRDLDESSLQELKLNMTIHPHRYSTQHVIDFVERYTIDSSGQIKPRKAQLRVG